MRLERRALPMVLAASLFGCGGDDPASPPIAAAVPSPAPTPSATPTPPPASAATARGASRMPECGAAEGPKGVFGCCREERTSLFEDQVAEAIRAVQRENPTMFDGDKVIGNADEYVDLVAKRVASLYGLCATGGGPDDEIGVKRANDVSEQFDILYGAGFVNHYGYAATCKPARF